MYAKGPIVSLACGRSLIKVIKMRTEIHEENTDCNDHVDKQPMSKSREAILLPKLAFEIGIIYNNTERHLQKISLLEFCESDRETDILSFL